MTAFQRPHSGSGPSYIVPLAVVVAALVLVLPLAWLAVRGTRLGGLAALGPELLRRIHGALMVLLVVVLFTSSTIVTQLIFEEQHYRKPFFVTLLCFSTQSIYLFGYRDRTVRAVRRLANFVRGKSAGVARRGLTQPAYSPVASGDARGSYGLGPFGVAWRLGCVLLSANLFFNVSLQYTSVSASTVISSSSAVWTLLFRCASRQRLTTAVQPRLPSLPPHPGPVITWSSSPPPSQCVAPEGAPQSAEDRLGALRHPRRLHRRLRQRRRRRRGRRRRRAARQPPHGAPALGLPRRRRPRGRRRPRLRLVRRGRAARGVVGQPGVYTYLYRYRYRYVYMYIYRCTYQYQHRSR